MTDTSYYVKKVRRNDDSQIVKAKTSKTLEAKPKKVLKRKKIAKHIKKGKTVKTSYLKDSRWTEGDTIKLQDKKWLKTEGNQNTEDNLGKLKTF